MNKSITVCFIGHRRMATRDVGDVRKRVEKKAEALIQLGFTNFLCGGAIGFDTLAGFVVLKLKERFPSIKLVLILPCHDQDVKWTRMQKADYQRLLLSADEIRYIANAYNNTCMLQRNQYMLDHSACCVGYCVRPYGGTAYTMRLAKEKQLIVYNLDELNDQSAQCVSISFNDCMKLGVYVYLPY